MLLNLLVKHSLLSWTLFIELQEGNLTCKSLWSKLQTFYEIFLSFFTSPT